MIGAVTNRMTLYECLIAHRNDYGARHPPRPDGTTATLPSLTIVVPYFETGSLFDKTLVHVRRAIEYARRHAQPGWSHRLVVVDDGSTRVPLAELEDVTVIRHPTNRGRTAARNSGLASVSSDLCLFVDSDVAPSEESIFSHLNAHVALGGAGREAVTVGLFRFSTEREEYLDRDVLRAPSLPANDWRISCIYGRTWIGCAEDRRFIGHQFEILKQTDEFRNWPSSGFLGPWVLPNMVLGGFFMVRGRSAQEAGGFDRAFDGYGFTETSLATKLIALGAAADARRDRSRT